MDSRIGQCLLPSLTPHLASDLPPPSPLSPLLCDSAKVLTRPRLLEGRAGQAHSLCVCLLPRLFPSVWVSVIAPLSFLRCGCLSPLSPSSPLPISSFCRTPSTRLTAPTACLYCVSSGSFHPLHMYPFGGPSIFLSPSHFLSSFSPAPLSLFLLLLSFTPSPIPVFPLLE